MSPYYDICVQKNVSLIAVESRFNARHDVSQVRFGDAIVVSPPVLFTVEQAAPLHQPQVLGRHVAGNVACLGQLSNGVSSGEQHLHDP